MSLEQVKIKTKSFFKKLLIILTIASILLGTIYYFYRTYTLSEGTRTGILFKISKKGKVFKTYEGQLQLAGAVLINKASTWEFSVVDEHVYNIMQTLEGKNVRVHYKEMIDAFAWQGDTNYMIYNVEEIK